MTGSNNPLMVSFSTCTQNTPLDCALLYPNQSNTTNALSTGSEPAESKVDDGHACVGNADNGYIDDVWSGQETFADHQPTSTVFVIETASGQGFLAVGNTLLVGMPKAGKSSFTYGGLVAGLTQKGGAFRIRGNGNNPAAVLVASQEDPSGQISAQILGSNGNTKWVRRIDPAHETEGSSDRIRKFLHVLDEKLTQCPDCKLVVIDTLARLASVLSFSIRTEEVRKILDGTQRLGEKHKVAFLWIHHFNKSDSHKSLSAKISGSGQILATVRAMWVLGSHPEDSQRRGLAYYQGNINPELESMVFTQKEVPYETVRVAAERNQPAGKSLPAPDEKARYMEVVFVPHVPISAEDLTRKPASKSNVIDGIHGDYGDENSDEEDCFKAGRRGEGPVPVEPSPSKSVPQDQTATIRDEEAVSYSLRLQKRRDKNAPRLVESLFGQIIARFNNFPDTRIPSFQIKEEMATIGLKETWYAKLSKLLQGSGLKVVKLKSNGEVRSVWLRHKSGQVFTQSNKGTEYSDLDPKNCCLEALSIVA